MRRVSGIVLLLLGAAVLRTVITGDYTSYVRVGMKPLLFAVAGLLALIGLVSLLADNDEFDSVTPDATGEHAAGHSHSGAPRAGWLLLLPAVVALVVLPGALSASAVGRAGTAPTPKGPSNWPALHADASGAVPMGFGQATMWILGEPTHKLRGVPLRLTGFAVPVKGGDPDRIMLTRFAITCCAADASPYSFDLQLPVGTTTPPENAWLNVVASWTGDIDADGHPVLSARTVQPTAQPADPYDSDVNGH